MSNPQFDKTFGSDFLARVPRSPGVYRYLDADGVLLYVGKAADLRARLGQYRNASRKKADRKMRRIVRESASISFEVTATEQAALLLENELIRTRRPPLNVAGAFSFLYPVIGVRRVDGTLHLALSSQTVPLQERGFELVGAYRNRRRTRGGFDAIVDVLKWLGHSERPPERLKYTSWHAFRQIPSDLDAPLLALLRGESPEFLQEAVLALLEKPSARRAPDAVQKALRKVRRFYRDEARRLAALLAAEGVTFIPQDERDAASIRAGFDGDED